MHPTRTVKTGWRCKTDNSLAKGTMGHMTRCSSTEQINAGYIEYILWWHSTGKVHARTGHKGSTLSLTSALDAVGGQGQALAALLPGKEAGWATEPVWMGAENHASTGIWSPDHLACSKSLYQLRYPVPQWHVTKQNSKLVNRINPLIPGVNPSPWHHIFNAAVSKHRLPCHLYRECLLSRNEPPIPAQKIKQPPHTLFCGL
jgi:hypothetical protein